MSTLDGVMFTWLGSLQPRNLVAHTGQCHAHTDMPGGTHLKELGVLIDGQAQLDHAVNASAKGVGLVQAEAAHEQGLLVQQQHQVLDGAVALVGLRSLPDLLEGGRQGKSGWRAGPEQHWQQASRVALQDSGQPKGGSRGGRGGQSWQPAWAEARAGAARPEQQHPAGRHGKGDRAGGGAQGGAPA